jgi:hypothetical protein
MTTKKPKLTKTQRLGLTEAKSKITPAQTEDLNALGRSYYLHCLEQAQLNIRQARMIVSGDIVEESHELPLIDWLLSEAIEAS